MCSFDLPSTRKKAARAITCPAPCPRSWTRLPPKETFIARYNLVYYNGDIGANEPLAHRRLANGWARRRTSWAHGLTLVWRPPIDLGERWSYALSATVPFVWMDVTANVTAGATTVRRTSSVNGLGDIVLMPLMLNYSISSNLNVNFRAGIYAPTGDYEVGRLANTGKNFWTFEPTLGLMYFGVRRTASKPRCSSAPTLIPRTRTPTTRAARSFMWTARWPSISRCWAVWPAWA